MPDGLWRGSSTVVSGNSGSGKTLFGLHFIFSGADGGETGMIATFQENPVQLARICSGFGWNLESDMVHVAYRSPVDLHIDEWVYDLLTQAQDAGVKWLLIDSLGDIKIAADEEVRFPETVACRDHRGHDPGEGLVRRHRRGDRRRDLTSL